MRSFSKSLAAASLAAALTGTTALADSSESFELKVGFADILRVEGGISTVVLGNPDIADATPMDSGAILLNGRAAGTTNVMVLDESGNVIADLMLHVSSRQPGTVTVRRGMDAQVYTCTTGLCSDVLSRDGNAAPSPAMASVG